MTREFERRSCLRVYSTWITTSENWGKNRTFFLQELSSTLELGVESKFQLGREMVKKKCKIFIYQNSRDLNVGPNFGTVWQVYPITYKTNQHLVRQIWCDKCWVDVRWNIGTVWQGLSGLSKPVGRLTKTLPLQKALIAFCYSGTILSISNSVYLRLENLNPSLLVKRVWQEIAL